MIRAQEFSLSAEEVGGRGQYRDEAPDQLESRTDHKVVGTQFASGG